MRLIIITALLPLMVGCSLNKTKGEDVINMMISNGCNVKSYAERKEQFKVECFKNKSEF